MTIDEAKNFPNKIEALPFLKTKKLMDFVEVSPSIASKLNNITKKGASIANE